MPTGEEFEPFRPSEHLDDGEQADHYRPASDGVTSDGRPTRELDEDQGAGDKLAERRTDDRHAEGRRRWWTEDVPRPYQHGDKVKAARATGGTFITHVPKGTKGRITSTRNGLLGGDYATVEFDNGYIEEVQVSDLERGRSWWQ